MLRGQTTVELRRDTLAPKGSKSRRGSAADKTPSDRSRREVTDDPLFEALRNKRRELAQAQGVPPYIIFHDTTLREMASLHPRDLAALSRISGVGKMKLDRYGADFLSVLCEDLASSAGAD